MALMPVADALARVLADAAPLPAEDVPLSQAHGCVLATDVKALRTQPPADVSAMDGYAVRAADVATVPARLKVIGEVAAGHPFDGSVGPGEAARIFTGGLLPQGTDTVVIQENTAREDNVVVVQSSAPKAKNVRRAGLDFAEGDVLLKAGARLTDRQLALGASMNHATLTVHRPPRVAVLATGDELVPPGSKLRPGDVVYSNGFALMAMARNEGADTIDLGIAPDRLDETVAAVRRAREAEADILVTSGGVSVGERDLVQAALTQEGLDLSFWRIAMRPGKPMMHGRLGAMHALGLPGNPVSAFVCAFLFMVPLIRKLAGRADLTRPLESARLGRDLPANDEREDYLRSTLAEGPDGVLTATPFTTQDSSMLRALAEADCFVIRPPHAPAAAAGSPCTIVKLDR